MSSSPQPTEAQDPTKTTGGTAAPARKQQPSKLGRDLTTKTGGRAATSKKRQPSNSGQDLTTKTGGKAIPAKKQQHQKLGQDEKPGQAKVGSVLAAIESGIDKQLQSDRDSMDLEEMCQLISNFEVVQNQHRPVCLFYVSRCIEYYRKAHCESFSGRSVAANTSDDDGRSQSMISGSSHMSAPSLAGGRPQSSLDLDDMTSKISIILPNNSTKPVTSANRRSGSTSYISPKVVERCDLEMDSEFKDVMVDLRYTVVSDRGRSYRVSRCSFQVKDGLDTDVVVGIDLQERLLQTQTEYSFDASSTTDSDIIHGEDPFSTTKRKGKAPSYAGSSRCNSVETVSSAEYLRTLNRIIDTDPRHQGAVDNGMHRSRRRYKDKQSPVSPSAQYYKKGDSGYDSELSTQHQARARNLS